MHETRDVPSLIDSTGVGDPIVERLQRGGHGQYLGFHFSQRSKQQLMEGLAAAIQQRLIAFPPGVLVGELEAFEYRYIRTGVQYAAPEGRLRVRVGTGGEEVHAAFRLGAVIDHGRRPDP